MSNALKNQVKDLFISKFKQEPVLIFSPGRINLIGEHTDYNDGFAFPAAINKGIFLAIQKTNNTSSTIHALDVDESFELTLNNLKPIAEGNWENYIIGVIAELQNKNKTIQNFNIVFGGDIPIGSGMSSSAALENAVVFGLNELFNLGLSKSEMILISQKAEHDYVGVKCGIMDQYASMFGIENNALLLDCRTTQAKSYPINFENHQIILVNTNVKHSLAESAYNNRRSVCESIAALLNVKALRDASLNELKAIEQQLPPEDYQKARFVIEENNRTVEAAKAITNNNLDMLGKLMFLSHRGLQHQYKVSCQELDFLVDYVANTHYVTGARMMGGGFGGCTINLVEKDKAITFKNAITKAYQNVFNKDCDVYFVALSDGTKRIN